MKLYRLQPALVCPRNHLADLETCPHCRERLEFETWRTRTIAACIATVWGKHEDGVAIFECPKCFKNCWVHFHLSMCSYYKFPKAIQKAVDDEFARRRMKALREWPVGICWRCRNLESGEVTTHAWRRCVVGCGPPVFKCGQFQEVRK